MSSYNLSIIVPVYNEISQIEPLIRRLRLLSDDLVKDLIIVDGGSTDGTAERLAEQFMVVTSKKGRGIQMNTGAQSARGKWLLFLHADTELGPSHIETAILQGVMFHWGRFDVQLTADLSINAQTFPFVIISFT